MTGSTLDVEEHPRRLVEQKGDYTFEVWIEIGGNPSKIYDQVITDAGDSEAWVASTEGMVSLLSVSAEYTYYGCC